MSIKDDLMDRSITAAIQSRRKDGSINPLTQPFRSYLTEVDDGPCERLEPKWQGRFIYQYPQGIDTDEFRKQCEDIDNES